MTVGNRITRLRKARGLQQAELARLMDVSRQAVSKWENGQSAPDTMNLLHLADILDTTVDYLATGSQHPLPSPAPRPAPAEPLVIERIVEVEKPVERIVEVEKPVLVEKIVEKVVEIPVPVEKILEKRVIRRVTRTRLVRNPLELLVCGFLGLILGVLLGWLLLP